MAEFQRESGGCHCGRVRFEVDLDLTEAAIVCNCSICQKTGTMLRFVSADAFRLVAGEDALVDYVFNQKKIHHLFCRVCGIRSFARGRSPDGSEVCAVNVRCLDDLDLRGVPTTFFDGRSS